MAADGVGSFALVLHTHLPFVLGHGRWPHGSDWLMEVAAGCYLPLLDTIGEAAASGVSPRITIDVSPVLAGQLAAPAFRSEFEEYLRARISSARENRQEFAAANQPELAHLAEGWEGFYRDRLQQFERLNGDLVGALRALADEGHVTLITCAATHGYLPLLSREESIALQLRVAVTAHRRHFGRAPDGIWLPECAYRPRYEWTPPVGPHKGGGRVRRRHFRPLGTAREDGFVPEGEQQHREENGEKCGPSTSPGNSRRRGKLPFDESYPDPMPMQLHRLPFPDSHERKSITPASIDSRTMSRTGHPWRFIKTSPMVASCTPDSS